MFKTNSSEFFTLILKKRHRNINRYKKRNNKNSKKKVIHTRRRTKPVLKNKRTIISNNNYANILKEGIVLVKGLKPKIVHRTWKTKPEGQMLMESNRLSKFLGNNWKIKW